MIHSRAQRVLLQGVILLLVFILGGFTSQADTGTVDPTVDNLQALDLSNAILQLTDLPPGFQDMPENQKDSMKSMLDMWEGQLKTSNLEMLNFTGYWTADPENPQFVISGLVAPLSAVDQIMIDKVFNNPDMVIEQLQKMVRGEDTVLLKGAESLGDSNLAFSTLITSVLTSMRLEYVVIRRGPVLVEVACIYMDDQQPIAKSIDLARLLDDRVAAVVGRSTGVAFRPSGPLVPKLTTYIPTPLDVSTQPAVIGTNLLLAALLMLLFTVASEIFTRTLSTHEAALQDQFRSVAWLRQLQEKLERAAGSRLSRRPALRELFQLLGVVLFYGLVFSLLDSTWNPFSLQGLVLLISMMIAFGLVGIAGDIIQWRIIRRWGLVADLTVRPTNLLLAIFSTTTSRLFTIVPGLMFGTPEALKVDDAQFDPHQRSRLLKVSALTFIAIGLVSWLLTAVTAILQRVNLPDSASNALGGLEAFLLVIFAVTLENLFVQMLGLPGGLGQALKKANRWVWLASLVGVTFLFYHTLINPRGELARAFQTANVQLTLGVAASFMVVAFGMYFTMERKARKTTAPVDLPESSSPQPQQLAGPRPVDPSITPTKSLREIQSAPVYLSLDEDKTCPVCASRIKAEARICRFCRARFMITLRGYCLADHDVVEVTEENRCVLCAGEVADLHVESHLHSLPAAGQVQVSQLPAVHDSTGTSPGTRACPACGEIIQAKARICRFCRIRLD